MGQEQVVETEEVIRKMTNKYGKVQVGYYYTMYLNNGADLLEYLKRGKIKQARAAFNKYVKALKGMGESVVGDFQEEISDIDDILTRAERLLPLSLREWQDMPLRKEISNIRFADDMPQSIKDYYIKEKQKIEARLQQKKEIYTSDDDGDILD